MIVLADLLIERGQGRFLPATVDAELEFDSLNPPPDKIEEEDEGQLPVKSTHSG